MPKRYQTTLPLGSGLGVACEIGTEVGRLNSPAPFLNTGTSGPAPCRSDRGGGGSSHRIGDRGPHTDPPLQGAAFLRQTLPCLPFVLEAIPASILK